MNRWAVSNRRRRAAASSARRSGGRHRAPARSGAVRRLRRRRMGHVPQRPIHRARHQGSATATAASNSASSRISSSRSTRASKGSGVLLEPTSVVAKAWEQIGRIGARAPFWQPRVALVTGAGPVGLLAAMIGVQRGFEMHVLDRAKDGLKPKLVRASGRHLSRRRSRQARARHRHRMHRRRFGGARCHGARRARRHRLPRRRLRRRPHDRFRYRRIQPRHGAARTIRCSARSMPTAAITATPPMRWPRPIRPGSSRLITPPRAARQLARGVCRNARAERRSKSSIDLYVTRRAWHPASKTMR